MHRIVPHVPIVTDEEGEYYKRAEAVLFDDAHRSQPFITRLRAAREPYITIAPAAMRHAAESKLRKSAPEWYDILTTMPIKVRSDHVAEIASMDVYNALGIPEAQQSSRAREVVDAMVALGWTCARVGGGKMRKRGFRRLMKRLV